MVDLRDVLDALDLALARSEDVLEAQDRSDLVRVATQARTRGGFLGEAIIVALAGGTGSGKSSILNALAGTSLVRTGVVRPTTQRAVAVHAPRDFADLAPLLEALDVEDVIVDRSVGDVIYVDLPDFDSTEVAHRHVVERVLPRVDAVIWVLDPEKYADPVLHHEFLRRLVPYERQFVFAINQIDRLGEETEVVVERLRSLLDADGFSDPHVVATVAAPRDRSTPVVDDLSSSLESRLDAKTAAVRKIAIDVRAIAGQCWAASTAVDTRNLGQRSRDRIALAAATFVSLGVTAYELYDRVAMTLEG